MHAFVKHSDIINALNAELNPTCHLLELLGAHHIFHVRGLRVKVKHFILFYFFLYIRDQNRTVAMVLRYSVGHPSSNN